MTNKEENILRDRRERKGYSQREIAEKLGMTVNGYSFIERGIRSPSPKVWLMLKDILGLDNKSYIEAMKENVAMVAANRGKEEE